MISIVFGLAKNRLAQCKGGFIQNATANAVCGVELSKTN